MPFHHTLRIQDGHEAGVAAVGAFAAIRNIGIEIVRAPECARAYALLRSERSLDAAMVRDALGPKVMFFAQPVIALALRLTPPETLPAVREALAGPGQPGWMLACERHGDQLIVEATSEGFDAQLYTALLEAAMRPFGGGTRVTHLLAPLPDRVLALLAAQGLQAPELDASRILENALERAGLNA